MDILVLSCSAGHEVRPIVIFLSIFRDIFPANTQWQSEKGKLQQIYLRLDVKMMKHDFPDSLTVMEGNICQPETTLVEH